MQAALAASNTGQVSRQAVYDFIHAEGLATKSDIALGVGASVPTVSKYVKGLLQLGLIAESEKLSSGSQGGRNPAAFATVPNGRLAVGVDITSHHVTCVLVNLEHEFLAERRVRRAFSRDEHYYRFVSTQVDALVADAGLNPELIYGVAIALPGLISTATGLVTYGRVLGNTGMGAEDFAPYLRYPVRLVHDSDAAGFAEFWAGASVPNAMYVSLSSSVGGAAIIDSHPYRGDGEFAAEIGHLTLHPGGRQCYCGQRGHADPYLNARVLADTVDGTVEGFFAALGARDAGALACWDAYTSDLARVVADVRALFGCTIILGGDIGAQLAPHLDDVRAKVGALTFNVDNVDDLVLPCQNTRRPVATGAAFFLVEEFRQEVGLVPVLDRQISVLRGNGVPGSRRKSKQTSTKVK